MAVEIILRHLKDVAFNPGLRLGSDTTDMASFGHANRLSKEKIARPHLWLAGSAWMMGVFFMQALYEGFIRGSPLAYLYALGVIILSVVVVVHGRRILREGLPPAISDA